MTLAPLAFIALYCIGLAAAIFVAPQYGFYTYLLAFHMSPAGTWWEHMVPELRYLMIAAIVALVAIATRSDPYPREQWLAQPVFRIFLAFNVLLWLMHLWVISPLHMEGCILFAKHLIISFIVYRIAKTDLAMVKNISLSLVVGCAWFGWMLLGKGGRVEGAAGAIADANTLGMHCAVGVMVASMMLLGLKGIYRWAPFIMIPLILNTVILAGSRGAFVGLLAGGLVARYFCPEALKPRFLQLGALGVMLFFLLAHEQFIDRLVELYQDLTEEQEELDTSASSRIAVAKAGWRMALDYPLGVGHRGTAYLSPRYLDAQWLTSGEHVGATAARAAHNTFMAALVSYGFLGLFLYTGIFVAAARSLIRLKRIANVAGDTELGAVVAGIASGLAVVLMAGQFSNYVYAEVQFWLLALTAALTVQQRGKAAATVSASSARRVPRENAVPRKQRVNAKG